MSRPDSHPQSALKHRKETVSVTSLKRTISVPHSSLGRRFTFGSNGLNLARTCASSSLAWTQRCGRSPRTLLRRTKLQEVMGPWPEFHVQAGRFHLVPVTLICRTRQYVD